MGSNIRSPICLMAFYNPMFHYSIFPPPSTFKKVFFRISIISSTWFSSMICFLSSQKDWSSRSLPSWPSPLILHGLKKCWLMDWFHINISTMFVAATFRLGHVHSGICRSGYRLWFVILSRNHSIRILLVFNFTPLSNFSLSLFQTKVFHRRIANETNDNELNE